MKHDYKVQTVLERGDERSTWKGRGWVGVGLNPGRIFFFFIDAKMQGLYVWVCVSVLFPRIEPVGKPYREVCLQTLLWPWKVHRPSSWSLLLSELALKLKVFFLFFFKWEKKEEIWLCPVTKTPTPTEQSKKQRDNIKTPPKTWLFWVVLNILSTNELKKKSWVFLGFDPGASESGVRRSTNWARDLIQGPLNLASDALPTELRGLSLQGNS